MGRPKKATVDYFPHVCVHGKTMFILEQRFGNDGYAFWFKLLETLGTTGGHVLDCSNEATWEFLQAKTRLGEDICSQILDLLAQLDAIDHELWKERRVVWSQNFVDGVVAAYRNRRVEIPVKPSFYSQKPATDGVSTHGNPHTILDETILDETKKESSSAEADFSPGPPVPYKHLINLYHLHCPTWPKVDVLTEDRKRLIRQWWATLNGETHRFELAFQKASASDFLSGRNGKWKSPKPCDLDWLLKESNLAVVLEGGYDEHKRPEPHRPPPPEAILPMSDEESAEGLAQLRELAAKLQRVPGGKREVAP